MSAPLIQTNRPRSCVTPRPAREMSRRGLIWLAVIYGVLFGAGVLKLALAG